MNKTALQNVGRAGRKYQYQVTLCTNVERLGTNVGLIFVKNV